MFDALLQQELNSYLEDLDPVRSLKLLQEWLPCTSYADICDCLDACPPPHRVWLQSMLSDLLSGYPSVRFGLPVLIHYTPPEEHQGDIARIPLPPELPGPSVRDIRWLELDALETSPFIAAPHTHSSMRLVPHSISSGTLILETDTEIEIPEPPTEWWVRLLELPEGGMVQIAAGHVRPWLEAAEMTLLMSDVTSDGKLPERQVWMLSDENYRWAVEAARRFRSRIDELGE